MEAMGETALAVVVLPTGSGNAFRRRYVRQPTEHQKVQRQRLDLRLPTALERAAM
jgi:hypothetical protein